MPYADVGEVRLEYTRRGDPAGPTVLAVMGLGAQRIWWPPEFLAALVDEGLDVVAFDNRDAGLSTKMEDRPGTVDDLRRRLAGDEDVSVPYTLSDMAGDAVGLLDHLGIERAHVVGASMGGMIAQRLALEHPGRVTSLISIMSTTGDPAVGRATPEASAMLLQPVPREREAYVRQRVEAARLIGSRTLFDEDRARRAAEAFYDRSFYPFGGVRQRLAILADGDRTGRLAGLEVPTLVVHGAQDTLIDVSGGRRRRQRSPVPASSCSTRWAMTCHSR